MFNEGRVAQHYCSACCAETPTSFIGQFITIWMSVLNLAHYAV